jgi:hypothetical protein
MNADAADPDAREGVRTLIARHLTADLTAARRVVADILAGPAVVPGTLPPNPLPSNDE